MTARLPLTLVAALGKGRCIGRAGALPWRVPEDLRRFRSLTTGHAIIMGRKTFESIGRPLPERRNLVVTRGATLPSGVEPCASLEEAVARAREADPDPRVIGGGEIYAQALPLATRLELTLLSEEVADCDAWFPDYEASGFVLTSREPGATPGVEFTVWERGPERAHG